MTDQAEKYLEFLKSMRSLREKLIDVFEKTVNIQPFPSFIDQLRKTFTGADDNFLERLKSGRPDDLTDNAIPMIAWIKPRRGIIQVENCYWQYFLHDSNEVGFQKLPAGIEVELLRAALQADDTKAVQDILMSEKDTTEILPNLDVTYLQGGRTDGFRAWAVYLYTNSVGSEFSKLDNYEHENLLRELIDEGVLQLISGGDGQHYVLTS
jgi:hypothetical protein